MTNQTIFITGASSGFGLITANILHAKGYTVYGTSRTPNNHQTDFHLIEMDVTKKHSVEKAVSLIIQNEGQIDVLINNAGVAMYGAIEEASEQNIRQLFETNVFGVIRTTAAVLPHMRSKRAGRIINVTSLAGLVPTPTLGIYCATKHAVEGYTKSLKFELEQFGIDVALVKPGEFMTNVFDNSVKPELRIEDYNSFRELIQTQMGERTADKVLPPGEVGELIADLVEQDNLVFDHLIGPYADVIPQLMTVPDQLHEVVRQAYQLHELQKQKVDV